MSLHAKITLRNNQQATLAQLFQAFKSDTTRTSEESSIQENLLKILSKIDVNIKDVNNKVTPLHIACDHKHIKACNMLLKRGADFTITNKNGNTVVHQAFYDMLGWFDENELTTGTREIVVIESVLKAHVDSGNSINPRSADGLSHFHIACATNNLEAVKLFLKNGVSINETVNMDSRTFPGYTPLHIAARFGSYETVKLLLVCGADVRAKSANKTTPLHLVILRKFELIRLRTGKNKNDLKLLDKCVKENDKLIALFLKELKDKRMAKVGSEGFSIFHGVCTLTNSSLAESLLKNFNVNQAISMVSHMCPGYTALHFAAYFNIKTSKLLLNNGANIEAKNLMGVTPFDIFRQKYDMKRLYDILLSIPNFQEIHFSDKKTKLSDFILAMWSQSTLKAFFQSMPKDVHLPKNCPLWPGFTVMHLAVLFIEENLDDTTKKIFGYDIQGMSQDAYGRTPLHLAFYLQKFSFVDLFFEKGHGETNVIDNKNLSYLHIACNCATETEVQALLAKSRSNANIRYNGQNTGLNRGMTPLHFAVGNGNIEIIKLLLEYGADANATDIDGMTPIHSILTLCPRGCRKEIGDLLFWFCELKDITCLKTGLSHLHVASYISNELAVKSLLKLGANNSTSIIYQKYNNNELETFFSRYSGYTPLHFAIEKCHTRIVKLLLGCDVIDEMPSGLTRFYEVSTFCWEKEEFVYGDYITTKFAFMLLNDLEIQKRGEEAWGLTTLHLACYLRDIELIKRLLANSIVNVNAQIHVNSRIWPRATPLHVFIMCSNNIKDLDYTVRLLLDNGADATLLDNNYLSPLLHIFNIHPEADPLTYVSAHEFIRSMVQCQTDFTINPVNKHGLSHFHVACIFYEHIIVEKFLQKGVDVNLPIYSCNGELTFQTPLHIVLQSKCLDIQLQLRTIDVLLKYGADVNLQDERGFTAFHMASCKVPSSRLPFFQRLRNAGADINYRNPNGQTALEIVFNSTNSTKEEIEFFLSYSNGFNIFNSKDDTGMIAKVLFGQLNYNLKTIEERMLETSSLYTIDDTKRTPIHNLVANREKSVSADKYSYYIKRFIDMGYDIDTQDFTGRSALHTAVHFHNAEAILGLLMTGADVNVMDSELKTPYVRWFELYGPRILTKNVGFRFQRIPEFADSAINKSFALHVIKLQLCSLEVHSENVKLANKELCENEINIACKLSSKEFEDTNNIKFMKGSLTLRDFISETGAVGSRPSMTFHDCEAVDTFFKSLNDKRFPELKCVLTLQYRKAMKRLRIIEEATDCLRDILRSVNGFSMPEICCRMIIRFLTNTEIKHLIMSVTETETT